MGGKKATTSTRPEPDPSSPQAVLALVIRELRLNRNLSQRELATLTDLERSTLVYIEKGTRSPSITSLFEIARALNVLPSKILSEVEIRLGLKADDYPG